MGKPLAGQLGQMGQMGSPTQSQMGGGFGGQQSAMQPQMPQQNLGGFGGGDMSMFQDLMRQQQQASQMPQQPAYGGFGNGMGINIAQPPQQSGGLLGSLSPQQNPGGFGNQQQSQLQQALQSFRGQQQMGQQAPQMPMIGPGGGGNRDFYDRQVSPEQRARNEAGMADGSYAAYYQQATGQPLPQQPMQPMPPSQPPTLGQATQSQMQQQPQQAAQAQQIYALNQQLQAQGRPGMLGFSPEQMQQSLNQVGGQPPQPQMPRTQPMPPSQPMRAPQQVRPEPPRMQAMRGIQQLASRQRGYNR